MPIHQLIVIVESKFKPINILFYILYVDVLRGCGFIMRKHKINCVIFYLKPEYESTKVQRES